MSKQPGVKPSELVLLAIHNLDNRFGASEYEIIKFICLKLRKKPDEIQKRVKSALARSLALQLVSRENGRYKLYDVLEKNLPVRSTSVVPSFSGNLPKERSFPKVRKRVWKKTLRRKDSGWRKCKNLPLLTEVKQRCKSCGKKRRLKNVIPEGIRLPGVMEKGVQPHRFTKSQPKWWW